MSEKEKFLALKRANSKILAKDELIRSPVSHGLPSFLTWTNTIHCNSKCIMCYINRAKPLPTDFPSLSFHTLEQIAETIFPTLERLNLTRRGEPFVDPNLKDIVNLAGKYAVKVDITTNGSLLTPELSRFLMPHLEDIKISVDGATTPVFESIRQGLSFDKVIHNVEAFIIERNRFRAENPEHYIPTITLEATLRTDNLHEFPDIIRLGAKLGVDKVKGYHQFSFRPDLAKYSLVFQKSRYNEIFTQCQAIAKELKMPLFMERRFMLESAKFPFQPKVCPYNWRKLWVDFNGDVLACMRPSRNLIGNLGDTTIEHLWNSSTMQQLRAGKDSNCLRCANQLDLPMEQSIPIDDRFFDQTWTVLDAYDQRKNPKEKTYGADWLYLWSRRTCQLSFPHNWRFISE
jgi:MoaA/NifB/PqqE/SkfB family radical SAM enzyme